MSIDTIRAKLLPKFVTTCRDRVAKARAAVADGAPNRVRDEMHAITGDAGMMGKPDVGDLARAASAHARAWEAGEAAKRGDCESALDALTTRLDDLATPG